MILKPGTGTNPFYARKHGHEIPNNLDKVLAGLCPDYQPTGATNSIDAAEMLWKGERVEFAGPAPTLPAPPPKNITYSNETFGTRRSQTSCPSAPTAAPKPTLAPADLPAILAPGHGWSEQDSQRQLRALQHCPGNSAQAVIRSAFDQSIALADKSFAKGGWSAALTTTALVTGVGAILTAFSNPALALGLAGTTLAGAAGSALLLQSSRKDHNNGEILSDLGRRLDAKSWGHDYDRHGYHGNYTSDFTP